MVLSREKTVALSALRLAMQDYAVLPEKTWLALTEICTIRRFSKGQHFVQMDTVPNEFGFVVSGLMRGYARDAEGNEYNKVFFPENTFPGSMVALLTASPSQLAIEALEPSLVAALDFAGFRDLLETCEDLKRFQIRYLEKNWVIEKEGREVALVQLAATARYSQFLNQYQRLEKRIPQYHIASHLGITPTQLSRIRKKLSVNLSANNQPM